MSRRYRGRTLRRGRCSIPGQVYLVTAVTRNRYPFFRSLRTARSAVRAFHGDVLRGRTRTLAFVVMPDHIHWMLELGPEISLSESVRLYKASVSSGVGVRLWQKGFHDRALRREEDLRRVARYFIANPLRAGLVDSIGAYPHWDAVWLNPDAG